MNNWQLFTEQFITYGGYKTVLNGLGITLLVAVLGLLLGIAIGILLAISKVIPQRNGLNKLARCLTDIYTTVFRGTPLVVQLLLGYFVIMPALGIPVQSIYVGIVVFGLNSGAYICEIMRSGLQSIDHGQLEAGRAVGLTYGESMKMIVVPQAIKNILPALGNEFISLIKETSVLSFIAIVDLTEAFKDLGSANYEYVVPYLMLALVYLVLVLGITQVLRMLERRLNRSDKRN